MRWSARPIAPLAADAQCGVSIRLPWRDARRGDAVAASPPGRDIARDGRSRRFVACAAALPVSFPVARIGRCAVSRPGAPAHRALLRLAPRQAYWRGAARKSPAASAAGAASATTAEPHAPAAPERAAGRAKIQKEAPAPRPRVMGNCSGLSKRIELALQLRPAARQVGHEDADARFGCAASRASYPCRACCCLIVLALRRVESWRKDIVRTSSSGPLRCAARFQSGRQRFFGRSCAIESKPSDLCRRREHAQAQSMRHGSDQFTARHPAVTRALLLKARAHWRKTSGSADGSAIHIAWFSRPRLR